MAARTQLLAALLISIAIVPAASASELRARAGMGFEPNGFVVGGQAWLGRGVLSFAPGVDVAFVEGDIATAYNLDLLLGPLQIPNTIVGLYGGAGLTFLSFRGTVVDGTTIVLGAIAGEYLFAESRIGLDRLPELRLLVGVRLRRP